MGNKVNKSDLIARMAEHSGLTKADSEKALNAFMASIKDGLKEGARITLVGFGTFMTSFRPATTGHNPRTRAPIKIKASKQVKFKPGKGLKDHVND